MLNIKKKIAIGYPGKLVVENSKTFGKYFAQYPTTITFSYNPTTNLFDKNQVPSDFSWVVLDDKSEDVLEKEYCYTMQKIHPSMIDEGRARVKNWCPRCNSNTVHRQACGTVKNGALVVLRCEQCCSFITPGKVSCLEGTGLLS